jgi:cytochrome P450
MYLSSLSSLELFTTLITAFLTIAPIYYLFIAVSNAFFHPLRKFPGPLLAAASPLYLAYHTMRGKRAVLQRDLHIKYGPIVRLAPNQLSFIDETAWKDIYGHKQGRPQLQKAERAGLRRHVYSIINAPDDIHARQRKMVSHAFSDRALRDQEPMLKSYADSLLRNLHQDAREGKQVDMVKAYNYTTFDIIGDFAFGESFGMLESRQDHAVLSMVFNQIRRVVTITSFMVIPGVRYVIMLLLTLINTERFILLNFVSGKVSRRIETGDVEKPDLMTGILKNNTEDGTGITRDEIDATASVLTIAGSETTATLLSGCTNLLLQNPRVMEKLKAEIRGDFHSVDDITIPKLNRLPYILAVLEESLRVYPPVPVAFPRTTPPEGISISGFWVPGDVSVPPFNTSRFSSQLTFLSKDGRWGTTMGSIYFTFALRGPVIICPRALAELPRPQI